MDTKETTSDAVKDASGILAVEGYVPSPISVVFNYWKEFNLDNARSALDVQGLQIANYQETSLKNRKKLAEAFRDFKKANPEEKMKLTGTLIKSFQEEVDSLTKRAKFGENCFLSIYQKLYEAPDPVPALASATELASKISELEQENRKMRQELEEFRTESAHLKNQKATVRRLEERNRQLEQQMEEKVKETVSMKQQVLAEESQKSLDSLKDREHQLHEQLRLARESVKNMQKLHEFGQTQLFELREKSEEEKVAKQAEMNLLSDEVERSQTILLSLEREKDLLKSKLNKLITQETYEEKKDETDICKSYELSLKEKERIISELHSDLHNIENSLAIERNNHVDELKKLYSVLDEKEKLISQLNYELNLRPTEKLVDDLRKQLKILQAVGYNSVEIDDWDEMNKKSEIGKLESLLLEKNRKLDHEITVIKMKMLDKEKEIESFTKKAKEMEKTMEDQRKLILKLEDDILKGSGISDRRKLKADDWESVDSGMNELFQSKGPNARAEPDENSMLAVVCGQRDRFKKKMVEIEEELRQTRSKFQNVKTELDKYKEDNIKLYEKIRYVQEYNSKVKPTQQVQNQSKRISREDLEKGETDVEIQYKKLYEERINPFAAFSNREKELRYSSLGFRDRITLSSGKFLLANKHARTFVFFYSIILHILVLLSMYRLSNLSHYSSHYKSEDLLSKQGALRSGLKALFRRKLPPTSTASQASLVNLTMSSNITIET